MDGQCQGMRTSVEVMEYGFFWPLEGISWLAK